ncbi:MAG: hypothetical protein NXY57DRAFT_979423 [Lentinula lateritia]|nr:MAG: hypothetical protein NXY57DRAFT_979423 [Lentinula lateritia]
MHNNTADTSRILSHQSIPPELKSYIATFCTPATLANLALVHKSFQEESEAILYKQLDVYIEKTESTPIWSTLKLHPDKALLVRSLAIWFRPPWDSHNDDVPIAYTELCCCALVNMHGLVDLRLHLSHRDVEWQVRITAVLSKKHFNLHSLHCSQFFDLCAITDAQSDSLQILGVFSNGNRESFLPTFQTISTKHPTLTLLSYEQEGVDTIFETLHIYPGLLQAESGFSWKPISDCFSRITSHPHIGLERKYVTCVCVCLSDIFDTQFLQQLVEEMIGLFPNIIDLELLFQDMPPEASFSIA